MAACETVVDGWTARPELRHQGHAAYYEPARDRVTMPVPEWFDGPAEYYSTLFHELTHATGHASRLDRKGTMETARFGSPTYSREELVAEMGAAFLCGHTGIERETLDNSAAYVAGWLRKLKRDHRLVVQAAAQAQKAADMIIGNAREEG